MRHFGRQRLRGTITRRPQVTNPSHNDLILDQFTRQATPFSTAATINDSAALQLIVETSGAGKDDTVLDVACGGGVVACGFAPHVKHVTGIDMTPAMLERGAKHAAELGLTNLSWQQGDVTTLPFADGAFSIVFTRFSFHHFLEPLTVLREMVRVCAKGGRVVVCDMYASTDPAKAATWNWLEKLRDPSHVRCLTLPELKGLFAQAGLPAPQEAQYELRDTVRSLLSRSFPNPGDDAKIIAMFDSHVDDGSLGLPSARREGGEIRYAYPVAILAAARL
jgi:ubiquinone/menaquinone biosynthesis C-methylase UbiE